MKKEATDFALLASAFAADDQMARQVCKLLADGDVNEAVARKMLGLVRDGKLKSPQPCRLPHYHWYYASSAYNAVGIQTGNTTIAPAPKMPEIWCNNSSLTSMAKDIAA